MSDKAVFDPAQNAMNAATALDAQINKIAQPGDDASKVAHDMLVALQNDAIPSKLQAQVYTDLMTMDPAAVAKAEKFLPDMTLGSADGNQVMRVTDNAAPDEIGAHVLRDVAMQAGGEIFSTGKLSKESTGILQGYAGVSDQQEAAAYVNNDLKLLGINNEQLVAADKQPGFFGQMVAAANPDLFNGVSGEYELADASGNVLQKIAKYSEKYSNQAGDYVNVKGSMVPIPGGALEVDVPQGASN